VEPAGNAPASAAAEPAAGGAAMRIYRDPATGAFIPPPPETAPPAASRGLSSSSQDLVETPGTSTASGVTLDLRGGFQSAISARVADDGRVHTRCSQPDAP